MKIYILPEVKSSPWIDLSSVAGAPHVPGLLSVDKEMIQANTNMLPPTMIKQNLPLKWGRDRMVVGFTTTYAISAYQLMLWVRISIRARCTTLYDKACQWLATGWWFSPGTPVSSPNKTYLHDITEILLKGALNTKNKK